MDQRFLRAIQGGNAKISFSQLGEDGVLLWLFEGKTAGFYVDVGCHHPYRYSNTAALHLYYGWSGINIDVEQRAIDEFKTERPQDLSICTAVGNRTGSVDASFFQDSALTTLDSAAASNPYFAHVPRSSRTVQVRKLGDILGEVLSPDRQIDFLNVDVEGLDLEVLSSHDWESFRPEVVAVEAHGIDLNDPQRNATWCFLRDKRYDIVSHVGVTSIFKSAAA